jgi:anti-sigma B factor antagonist
MANEAADPATGIAFDLPRLFPSFPPAPKLNELTINARYEVQWVGAAAAPPGRNVEKYLTSPVPTLTFILVLKLTWANLKAILNARCERIREDRFMSSQPRRRRLEVEDLGDVTVVSFTDRKILDEQNIQVIGDQLFGLVDENGRKKLLLNFGNVEYMSSAALGKLITLNKKVQSAGGRLVLCNIDPQIREVFEITKLDKLFVIRGDEQEALQMF